MSVLGPVGTNLDQGFEFSDMIFHPLFCVRYSVETRTQGRVLLSASLGQTYKSINRIKKGHCYI